MKLHDTGVYLVHGVPQAEAPAGFTQEQAKQGTIAYGILKAHNTGDSMQDLRMKFDSMTSHDITYVGIIQTARASGMTEFPLPYVMTNCHNSLCAVGGTINEDDHQFALSAAHKYGGIYVPPNMAVIHSYNREMMSGCGRMILGSDSHTRYGALGTMAVGEGGGELAKQLLGRTYDFARPQVIAIYLTGKPRPGIGPHDVALSICGAVYKKGYVKNKVMEFVGPGVANLSADYRNGIDVMTTETTCWSSIWQTDDTTKEYFVQHGRPEAYKELKPADVAYYDGCIELDLSTVECMIALPMHPSYAYPIRELKANAKEILQAAQDQANRQLGGKVEMDLVGKICDDGRIYVDQGVVAGCSGGTYENICAVADIIKPDSPQAVRELQGMGIRVVMLTGDGSFHMNLNEACTAVSYDLPIITVIFNNQVLGMVRQWQTTFYEKRYSDTDPHRKTDFVKLAEGFGAKGYRAATPAEFKAAFADAMKQKGPSWIDCRIGKDEKVLPMIPGGGTVNDIIME